MGGLWFPGLAGKKKSDGSHHVFVAVCDRIEFLVIAPVVVQ
jgi:hypothetical protein